jgi:hypothetical protein
MLNYFLIFSTRHGNLYGTVDTVNGALSCTVRRRDIRYLVLVHLLFSFSAIVTNFIEQTTYRR